MIRITYHILLIVLSAAIGIAIVLQAGLTHAWLASMGAGTSRAIQLRVWDWWSPSGNEAYGAYFAAVKETFEQRHPDVEIIYQIVPFGNYVQKLSTAMVGQSPPDVFQSSVFWAEGLYRRGMLRPLNDLLERETAADSGSRLTQDAFLPSAWRHNHTLDGVVFGIPMIIDALCLIWNLDILKRAARRDAEILEMFERHRDGTTDYTRLRYDAVADWDHFRRIMTKLTIRKADGTLAQAGFVMQATGVGARTFSPWLASNGGRYQDAAGTRAMFDTPAGVEAMEFLAKLCWEDRVCSPFRLQMSEIEEFQKGRVAATVAGTWSGKDIIRNTLGWQQFAKTAFPPGPRGREQKTVSWGNMLVISNRTPHVEAAWHYIRFVNSLEGNLLRLKHLDYIGPRFDFYQTPQWQRAVLAHPYLSNVKQICLAGAKLRHTEIIAPNHQANPIIETILLRYPDIIIGQGPYPSVEAALHEAARYVNNVYRRYHQQVERWMVQRKGRG
jgi:multiple sugar transport system substrate-binding protein